MEVRCGNCDKLFRVANNKITGTGIKFPCTRCGDFVKITKEDYEHYSLSLTAVSVLDMFEQKPKPVTAPKAPEAEPVSPKAAPAASSEKSFDFSEMPSEQVMPDETPPPFAEPGQQPPVSQPDAKITAAVEPQPLPRTQPEVKTASTEEPQPVSAQEVKKPPVSEPKSKPEPKTEPKPEIKPKPEPTAVSAPVSKTAPAFEKPVRPEPPRAAAKSAVSPSARAVQAGGTQKDNTRASAQVEPAPTEKAAVKPSHSGRMVLVLLATFIIGALAAYGVFVYLQSSHPEKDAPNDIASVKGVQIINPAGSMEQNGDLLVTATIENTTDKDVAAWYVVIEVYDAQNVLLGKLRYLNGKQIYSRRDFDILSGRGMNVQELKAKYLQEKGVVLAPKASFTVEMRYLQPPAGIANIKALVLPFDPVQLYKEIAEEMK